jgi:hypothetical protein
MKYALLICLTLGLLQACSLSPQNVETKVFSHEKANHRTYSWLPDKIKRFVPAITFEVVNKTDELLAQKGYTRLDAGKVDFHLSFQLAPKNSSTEFRENTSYAGQGPGMTCHAGNCESTKHLEPIVNYKADILLQIKAQDANNNEVLWNTKSETSVDVEYTPLTSSHSLNVRQSQRIVGRMVKQMLEDVPARK